LAQSIREDWNANMVKKESELNFLYLSVNLVGPVFEMNILACHLPVEVFNGLS